MKIYIDKNEDEFTEEDWSADKFKLTSQILTLESEIEHSNVFVQELQKYAVEVKKSILNKIKKNAIITGEHLIITLNSLNKIEEEE